MRALRDYLESELRVRIAQFLGGPGATERATAAVGVIGGLIFTRYLNPIRSIGALSSADGVAHLSGRLCGPPCTPEPASTYGDSVALGVGKIEADLSSEVTGPPAPAAAAEVGVRWLPAPGRGDRCRGALASRFFRRALSTLKVTPTEVVTDAAAVYPAVLDELIPQAWHHVEQYANNPIEADHSQLKHRLRPMRGLRTDKTAQVIIAGHAFMQNLRRGHYELAVDAPPATRVAAAFTELAQAI